MGKNKIARFEENKKLPNVIQPTREEALGGFQLKGNWREKVFRNNNPIVLELGCGKGEYTVGMAKAFPDKNFIGVDIKGARFWFGAKEAIENNLNNAAFLRTQIELIDCFFAENEVDEIWITFPDPQPQKTRERKRLTSPGFLKKYKNILLDDGKIHLKTDSYDLYAYTLEVIKEFGAELVYETSDLYNATIPEIVNEPSLKTIQTHYENLFASKGFKICYIQFKIN